LAAVVWKDGHVEDADEIEITASSEDEAVREAKKRWRATVGVRWPHCRIQDVCILGLKNSRKTHLAAPPR
jgi:hypothetical protein